MPTPSRFSFVALLGLFILLFTASASAQQRHVLEGAHHPDAPMPLPFIQADEEWTSLSNAIEPRVEGHSALIDGKIYVFGGFQTQDIVPTDQNEVYTLATDNWSTFTPLPVPVTHVGSAEFEGKVWLAGGFALLNFTQITDAVHIYDTATGTWSAGPPLPEKRSAGAMVRLGRKLHYFSGLENRNDNVGDHYVLDLDEPGGPQTWSTAAPMPDPRDHHSGAVVAGKIYAIGGQFGHDIDPVDTNLLHMYDPATDTWTRKADLPYIRSHYEPGTIVVDGKIVIVGGRTGTQNCVNTITQYDPETDTWSELFTMPDCLLAPSAKVVGDEIYVSHGGAVSVLFPTTATRKRAFPRNPSDEMGFWPNTLSANLEAGASVKKESVIWTHTDEANYSIDTSTLPSWISSVSTGSGIADAIGDEVDLMLDATNLAAGTYSHTLTATAPGYTNATLTVTLTVSGDGAPLLSFSPSSVNLGDTPLGHTETRTVTVTNVGDATTTFDPFNISKIGTLIDFDYTGEPVDVRFEAGFEPVTLTPGASTTIDLMFTPISAGASSGFVTYSSSEGQTVLTFSSTGVGSTIARINTGGSAISPGALAPWDTDAHFEGGKSFSNAAVTEIFGTLDQEPYKSERSSISNMGSFAYRIPVPGPGTYITRLHFAETYFGAPGGSIDYIGRRVFDVNIEGGPLELDDYDIAAEVGPITAVVKSFTMDVNDGQLDIEFTASVDQPKVSAIEVFKVDAALHQYLESGWNLVGLPVTPADAGYLSIYNAITPLIEPFVFDANGYTQTNTMTTGTGYWMLTSSEGFQQHNGTDVSSVTHTLPAGWSLISGPTCAFPLADASGDTGILTPGTLFGYHQAGGYYAADVLQPGKGYWILTSQAGSVTMNCDVVSGAGKSQMQAASADPVPAHQLTLTDARGYSQTLYLDATGSQDAFMLPPLAPKGQVDVRFSNNSRLLTASEGYIRLQAMQSPIKVSLISEDDASFAIDMKEGTSWMPTGILSVSNGLTLDASTIEVLRIRSSETDGDIATSSLPSRFEVQSIYPNPFTTTATLAFDVPADGVVQVAIYDMLGQQVMVTSDEPVTAGSRRTVTIDGTALASGTYMYRLIVETAAGTESITGKLVRLR